MSPSRTARCTSSHDAISDRTPEVEPTHPDLPIALIEYVVRAEKLYDRVLHLDRRMYLDAPEVEAVNPVQSQLDRLTAAFRQ